jgi:SPX domain protein involved in polyphosphate accumulation
LQTASNPKLITWEMKFLLPTSQQDRVLDFVASSMKRDPHCESSRGYLVQSLYLDTPARDVLHRSERCKGTKYRIRRYDRSAQVFLERKSKIQSQLTKKRIPIELDRLSELDGMCASTETMATSFGDNWFYQDAHRLQLQPVCLVQYERQAYFLDTDYNSLRLTLDRNLKSSPCNRTRFSDQNWQLDSDDASFDSRCNEDPMQYIMRDYCVMELKFVDSMPLLFKQLLSQLQIEATKFSKYRTAMIASHSVAPTDQPEADFGIARTECKSC